ncbi:glycosyltransferase [Fervidobacterium sp.]
MSDFPELPQLTELITQGRFSEAKQIAEKLPDIVQQENAFGMIYYYEGKLDDAVEHFKKALEIDPINSDVLFNYGKALFDKKDYKEAWRYLLRIHNKDWAVYDLLGDTQLVQGNIPMALYYYRKAAEISPLEEMKKKYLEYKKQYHQDVNIAILCLPGLDNFIHDIADILGEVYNVRLVVSANGNEIVQAYEWADIVWLEWANELAVEVTNKLEKKGKKIVCRLHGYESLRTDFLSKINWMKVDTLLFVAENVLNTALENCKHFSGVKKELVYNGLNLARYTYRKRKPGKRLVFAGHFNYKKNPMLAVQILKKLTEIDRAYTLEWAGSMQDERIYRYLNYILEKMGISSNFKFVGWKDNVDEYLEDKEIFLSTSIHEGYGVAILEAMAKGIKPVIHNFYIAEEFYPGHLIFNTVDEAVCMITSSEYDSEFYRRFVEDKASVDKQIREIDDIIKNL